MITKVFALWVVLLTVAQPIHALTLNTVDRGWYDSTGFHNPSNDNYFTGTHHYYPDIDLRSFYVFDLTGVSGEVTGAQLQLFNTQSNGYAGPNTTEELRIFDVTTPAGIITSGGSALVSVYDDLGTGDLLGTAIIGVSNQSSLISITLNQQAIAALNANLGGQLTLAAILDSGLNGSKIFGGTHTGSPTDGNTKLVLTVAAIPEPETYGMFLAGLGLVAFAIRSNRQHTNRIRKIVNVSRQ